MITTFYERWMVGLDLTDMDVLIVQWTNYLSKLFEPKVIYFIHIDRHFDIPTYVPHELATEIQAEDETHRAAIQKTIIEHFDHKKVEVKIEVIEGKPLDTMLHWVEVKKVDFFIAGRKDEKKGNGILPHKLSRKLSTPLLFVPEKGQSDIKEVLVPIDFSDHSRLAIETALNIASLSEGCNVTCFHVYNVPLGYYKTGKSYENFAELMKFNSIEHFQKFIKPLGQDIKFKPVLLDKAPAHELVHHEIKEGNYDLVIMGSKGQSIGSLMLLGSTTEKLIQINSNSLTWVVKMKDENMGFFQALKKI